MDVSVVAVVVVARGARPLRRDTLITAVTRAKIMKSTENTVPALAYKRLGYKPAISWWRIAWRH